MDTAHNLWYQHQRSVFYWTWTEAMIGGGSLVESYLKPAMFLYETQKVV